MQTTIEFLDAVKTLRGLTSDYQLSKHLECTHSAISNYRMKKNYLDEGIACRIADELDIEPSYVLACVASERAKRPEVKAAWKHAADLLYGLAAAAAVVAFLPFADFRELGAQNAAFVGAAAFQNNGLRDKLAEVCILCQTSNWTIYAAFALLFVAFAAHYLSKHNQPRL